MTQNEISKYITEISRIYKAGNATEHTYRPALQRLLENMLGAGVRVANEPKRITCGAPDYIITRNEIPVGYIEAKDIGTDLGGKANKEQFDRYRQSLDNLIITDYLTFRLYVRGELMTGAAIGEATGKDIVAHKSAFGLFAEIIQDFARFQGAVIKTSEQLSKMMAARARLLADSIESALDEDEQASNVSMSSGSSGLGGQLRGFREVLIPKITHKEFSDIYAQTIAYGMFAARLRDAENGEAFTRFKAAQLIPQSNPFLRKLFQYIAGYDLDSRISWMVDALADLFNCAYVPSIQEEFRKKDHDPMVHFYETFLAEYDPTLRKSRGVWYTPPPVVQFIVRAVDDILKTDFNIGDGLADTARITLEQPVQSDGERKQEQKSYHRVQILDPAAGTGTFLAEVVRNIYQRFENQRGMWRSYVGEHLIPRLNGFEILMASYAMAHLKLDMLLQETGYTSDANNRLRVYLTNSLAAAIDKTESPFAVWLSNEANEAGSVKKREVPVMVVLGNPPYSGESQNSGVWIEHLISVYKNEPTGGKLQERNPKWINDDYVKFIRYGQYFIEQNGEGVLAFINNHSFLDNPTFRGMRWSLLNTFDKIYILDLHGNSKKKETAPDGGKDENVFDIQQGVSINIFVKNLGARASRPHVINKTRAEGAPPQGKQAESLHYLSDAGETPALPGHAFPCLATVYHADLYGKRADKYDFLLNNNLQTVKWRELELTAPQYFFVAKDFSLQKEYEKGFSIKELFPVNSVGIVTSKDAVYINENKKELLKNIKEYFDIAPDEALIQFINYRPFDNRYVYYDTKRLERARESVMRHFLKGENIALSTCRQAAVDSWELVNITKNIVESSFVSNRTKEIGYVFPLYLYPDKMYSDEKRKPNLNETIINEISRRTELQFADESESVFAVPTVPNVPIVPPKKITPIDILDYIYAVLHSPAYREKYREFLKIDFPRVPYPQDAEQFWTLVAMGAQLRRLHLMEGIEPQSGMADFPTEGGNEIENLKYVGDKVYINKTQYFDHVPLEAWNFYIGGYQPAQKWLKDRKGRVLGYDDIRHYQRIIRVLAETGRIMEEIETKFDIIPMKGEKYG